MSTIFERIERKLDNIEQKAVKTAKKKVRNERIIEMARGMNFWEKMELHIKIGI